MYNQDTFLRIEKDAFDEEDTTSMSSSGSFRHQIGI